MEMHNILLNLFVVFFTIFHSEGLNNSDMGSHQIEYESITIKENTEATFSYQLRTTISDNIMESSFIVDVKGIQNGTSSSLCRCRWMPASNTTCKLYRNVSMCEVDHSEMRVSMFISRSYSHIMWSLLKRNSTFHIVKNTTLNVEYPAKVTGLQINGQEVNKTHVLDENQEANISCSFTNGNPPVTVLLLDNTKNEHSSSSQVEGFLVISRVFHCHDVWPTIRCEAPHSELNYSVDILVRCPPQFSSSTVELDFSEIKNGDIIFSFKYHTSLIRECVIRNFSQNYEEKKIACNVSGSPPHLTLNLHLATESWIGQGKWTLFLTNPFGISNTTFIIKDTKALDNLQTHESWIILVVFGCLIFVTIVAAAVVKRCTLKPNRSPQTDKETNRNVSTKMKVNMKRVSACRRTDDKMTSNRIIASWPETQFAVIKQTIQSNYL